MKPGAVSSLLFAITGVAIFFVSGDMLGVGPWGAAILLLSLLVAAAPYFPVMLTVTRGLAILAAVLAIAAVLLGLLAATTGGSFRLPSDQAFLLLLFFFYSIFGILFGRTRQPDR